MPLKKTKKAPRKKLVKKKPATKLRGVFSEPVQATDEGRILAKFAWEPSKPTDCQAIESVYHMQREKGRVVYSTDSTWKPVAKMAKFDGSLGRMVVLPRPTVYDRIRENSSS